MTRFALIEYLQEVELLQDVELLQEHLKILALFYACSSRFKVGLNDLSLVSLLIDNKFIMKTS